MNVSGGAGALTGRGRKVSNSSSRRPSRAMIEQEVIPSLIELVNTATDADILDSAILALGRTTEESGADEIVAAAMPLLAHSELSVQSSTALTLGVLGSPKAAAALRNILQDNSEGRRLTGGGASHWLVRAFAGLSLGLIGDEQSVATLKDVVARLPDKDKDIKVCAIVALGLVKDEA
ncbi:MAG: HEAT repeat domain-containing protein, partial [Planctomycetota bacterium]